MTFVFKKKDLLWLLGIITFWFFGRLLITLPEFIKKGYMPLWKDYYNYLIEGVIASSLGVILIKILRNIKDEVKETKVIGIKFVWHKNYIWHWIGFTLFFGIGRSLQNLYYNFPPNILLNFIKGAIIFSLVYIGAGLWEGNPEFFEGRPKGKKGEEK